MRPEPNVEARSGLRGPFSPCPPCHSKTVRGFLVGRRLSYGRDVVLSWAASGLATRAVSPEASRSKGLLALAQFIGGREAAELVRVQVSGGDTGGVGAKRASRASCQRCRRGQ